MLNINKTEKKQVYLTDIHQNKVEKFSHFFESGQSHPPSSNNLHLSSIPKPKNAIQDVELQRE